MKVIDLLNKIAKGEEVPKKIKYTWFYEWSCDNARAEYCYMQKNGDRFDSDWLIESILNDEVEIVEEEKELKKIDTISVPTIGNDREKNIENITKTLEKYWFSINELIDIVKELKNEKENN